MFGEWLFTNNKPSGSSDNDNDDNNTSNKPPYTIKAQLFQLDKLIVAKRS